MYFPPEVEDSEIPSVIRRLKEITGWKPWEKRLTWLKESVKKSVAMSHYWQERFGFELAFSTIHRRYKITGKYPSKNLTIDQQRFLSFAAMVVRCYERLSQHGQKRLRGMLLNSLKNDYGLGPLVYEIEILDIYQRKEDEQYTGLDYMTSDLILRRPQLMAVTYTAPGSIVHEPVMIGSFEQESRREVGPAYTIRNPNHPFANDTRYSLF